MTIHARGFFGATSPLLAIDAYDAQGGEPVAVIVDDRPTTAAGGELSWESVEETFQSSATRFESRMLAVRREDR